MKKTAYLILILIFFGVTVTSCGRRSSKRSADKSIAEQEVAILSEPYL